MARRSDSMFSSASCSCEAPDVSFLVVAQNDPDVREKIRQRIRPSAQ
jgi:hypothetical protein